MGRNDLLSCLAFLFCIGLLFSMAQHVAGARIAAPSMAAAPASVPPSNARSQGGINLDPFYSSKRKVPNGPDPIHNRREGKSGRPPGRS